MTAKHHHKIRPLERIEIFCYLFLLVMIAIAAIVGFGLPL
jgi:hypothetical protein